MVEIRQTSADIAQGDARSDKRLDSIEHPSNDLYRKTSRPGAVAPTASEPTRLGGRS